MTDDQLLDLSHHLDTAGDLVRAERVLLELLARRPFQAEALHRLASVLGRTGRFDQSVVYLRRAIKVTPADPVIWYHLGIALFTIGRLNEALDAYGRAIALKPDFDEARNNVSMILLLTSDFARGWPLYESRWGSAFMSKLPPLDRPRWTGGAIPGKRLLLHHEQGLGDTIHFARYAPILAGSGIHVVLAVQPPLVRVMQTLAMPVRHEGTGGAGLGGSLRVVSASEPLPPFDFYCPLLSLPGLLGTTAQNIPAAIPYLSADPADIARWSDRLGPPDGRRRVGIIWAGSPTNSNDRNRSVPAKLFSPLLAVPGIRLISVQTGPTAAELPWLSDGIFDAGSALTDLADTAGLLMNLDLLISVDTAAVHLAGALGRPVWVLTQFMPDWRWQLGRADSPWYPSVRLFRQQFHGDWTGTVAAIRGALATAT